MAEGTDLFVSARRLHITGAKFMNLKTAMCLSLCEEDVGFYGNNNLLYVTQ